VLVTAGAVQSNHARMTAAAARIAGVKACLVLTAKGPDPAVQGNLLLDRLLDAELRFVMPGEDADERIAETMVALRDRGERPYLIPVGGSNAIGALGYVTGTLELVTQLFQMGEAPSRLYYASGSRGTQAGLALGAKVYSAPYRLYGIAVSGGDPEKTERAAEIANEAATLLRVPTRLTADELLTDEGYFGEGYGIPTAGCLEAIRLLAHNEGIFLDPVYSGKAMAGMIDHIRRGEIAPTDSVVFLHTGGAPALFAQVDQLGLG
jgi:1-aminocyclopropane-1-carboxylate deaminase/D-cysteine desulfhydrase-like pyridoxal-dependent ACC family enzyme